MVTLLLAFLAAGADPDPAVPPRGLPPGIIVGRIDKGILLTEVNVLVTVPVAETYVEEVDGKKVEKTRTVYRTQVRTVMESRDVSKATATNARGKKIEPDDLAKRLAERSAIVLSADGKLVDPGFLRLFKDDTVVLVIPRPEVRAVPVPKLPAPK